GLLRQIHELRHLGLHPEREFVRADQSLDAGVPAELLLRVLVERLQEVEFDPLLTRGLLRVLEVRHLLRAGATRATAEAAATDPRALVHGREERTAVVHRAAVAAGGRERDEPGQVRVL